MALDDLTPAVREEAILAGGDITPVTRLEYFLAQAASEVPKPAASDAGKVLTVGSDGAYELAESSGGGVTPLLEEGVPDASTGVFSTSLTADEIEEAFDNGVPICAVFNGTKIMFYPASVGAVYTVFSATEINRNNINVHTIAYDLEYMTGTYKVNIV